MEGTILLEPKADPEVTYPLEPRRPDSLTRQEIADAVVTAPKLQAASFCQVARISTDLVVKYGNEVYLHEAKNMRFAATVSSVRLSKVHDAWTIEGSSNGGETVTYILMGFVHDRMIADIWPSLASDTRQRVFKK